MLEVVVASGELTEQQLIGHYRKIPYQGFIYIGFLLLEKLPSQDETLLLDFSENPYYQCVKFTHK